MYSKYNTSKSWSFKFLFVHKLAQYATVIKYMCVYAVLERFYAISVSPVAMTTVFDQEVNRGCMFYGTGLRGSGTLTRGGHTGGVHLCTDTTWHYTLVE